MQLSGDHITGNVEGGLGVTGGGVLGFAKQYIAGGAASESSFKAATFRQPDERSPIFGTAMDQKRAEQHIAKHRNAPQVVQRDLKHLLLLNFDLKGVVVKAQVAALGLNVEGVENLLHGARSGTWKGLLRRAAW